MKKWQARVLTALAVLVMAFALAACGGDSGPSGTYVIEGDEDSGFTVTFRDDDTFSLSVPYSMMGMDEYLPGVYLPGNFNLSGTFTVNRSARLIEFDVDMNSLRTAAEDLVDILIDEVMEQMIEAEFGELMDDPEMAAFIWELMDAMMDEMMDEMLDEVIEDMVDEFDEMTLRFERSNFDRLYDDEGLDGEPIVFVRR